jgi:hypothetical protein
VIDEQQRCPYLVAGLGRLRNESPRFWTDEELDDALANDCQVLSRTVEQREFADAVAVTKEIVESVIALDEPGVFDGRYKTVSLLDLSSFFGHGRLSSDCTSTAENAQAIRELSAYLEDCARWLELGP